MRGLTRIVVIGSGLGAWMSSGWLARALKRSGTEVLQVSAPGAPAPPVLASLPSLESFHQAMGFDLRDIIRATEGSFRLGMLNLDQGGVQVYGETGEAFGPVPFHLVWRAHDANHRPSAYGRYSLAALAGTAGRFGPPASDGPAGSVYSPGLHLDGPAYLHFLERAARHYGVIAAGNLGAGGVDEASGTVILDDGSLIEADLVIDTVSGRSASAYERFGGLPERLTVRYGVKDSAEALGLAQLRQIAGALAVDIPLQSKVIRVLLTTDGPEENPAGPALSKSGYAAVSGEALKFRPRRLEQPWTGKVVRIGGAACQLPPVEAVELRILQIGLEALLQTLPGSGPAGPESKEYNRLVGEAYQALADFAALAFLKPGRLSEDLSPTLRIRLENFTSRGRIVLMDGESFNRESWATALIAAGWKMERADAHASALPKERVRARLDAIAGTLSASCETLPDQRTFLRRAGLLAAQKTGAG